MERAVETFRGIVNTWECDEMGHMNVRFYVARAMAGASSLLLSLGIGPRVLRERGWSVIPHEHHLRFHREVRPGQSLLMRGGVVSVSSDGLDLYQELLRVDDQQLAATVRTRLGFAHAVTKLRASVDAPLRERASGLMVEVPEHGRPRGIALDPPRALPSTAEAERLGLSRIYLGQVGPGDVDARGLMRSDAFMGCISDGVPHFFRQLGELERDPDKKIGGAALEYRLVYRALPRVGDVLEIRAGLKAQLGKATQFCHWMFDRESGECVMTSEAVAVLFDLTARKAVAPTPDAIARLSSKVVPGLSV